MDTTGYKRKLLQNQPNKKKGKTFMKGNYNRYYGYRNAEHETDKRIPLFHEEWFKGKSCLDVGCNVGHMTLWIAKYFKPLKMKGLDVDPALIKAAKNNVVYYTDEKVEDNSENKSEIKANTVKSEESTSITLDYPTPTEHCNNQLTNSSMASKLSEPSSLPSSSFNLQESDIPEVKETNCVSRASTDSTGKYDEPSYHEHETNNKQESHGSSLNNNHVSSDLNTNQKLLNTTLIKETGESDNHGNLAYLPLSNQSFDHFPSNVSFVVENYVPVSENILKYSRPQYDVILCLSVTKWIQLNHGDSGLKLMFRKIYKQLNQKGVLILEPQPYQSYKRRKNLSPKIRDNYDTMKLRPEQFVKFLLSKEVGFTSCQQLDTTQHEKQGFKRPIYLLKKDG